MIEKYSDILVINHQELINQGAFDGFVNVDAQLYLDPFLLRSAKTPELLYSYKRFTDYFEEIIRILRASTRPYDRMFREAVKRLTFKESPYVSLGYSQSGYPGSGIGLGLAQQLTNTAFEIIKAGICDPEIFELIGLIENGIGADRISDMTIRIILPDILSFTERVARNLGIRTRALTYREIKYSLPYNPKTGKPVYLIPMEVLRDLPVALDWSDIDRICAHNQKVRMMVNSIIGNTWKKATTQVNKETLKGFLLKNPEVFQDLIDQYKNKTSSPYDFGRDNAGIFSWEGIAKTFAQEHPLDLKLDRAATPEQVLDLVTMICNHFKSLIENNGLNQLFYDDNKKLRHEKFAQLLFFGIADSYCTANNVDLTRESNAGRGPVDFKFSRGSKAKVAVEVKYSTNTQLVHGYKTQLPIYYQAEKAHYGVFLVIKTSNSDKRIRELNRLCSEETSSGRNVPRIIVADGLLQPSASKA